jgi:type II secretory pathway component PulF
MDEKNKNKKLFTTISIIVILLIFSFDVVYLWTNDAALKNSIAVIGGLLAVMWVMFFVYYSLSRKNDFNTKETKLQRISKIIIISTMVLGSNANTFVQDRALGEKLLVVEGLVILTAIALAGYDWTLQRRARKGLNY